MNPGRALFGVLLLLLMVCAAYLPAFHAGFIWDDDSYLTGNPLIREPGGFAAIWWPGNTPQFYPLVFSGFWIEYRLWGLDPMGYHAVNILLHGWNAIALWWLMRCMRVPGAFWIGAFFAVHPIMVESVAWITERKNVLSMAFMLPAAIAYLAFDSRHIDRVCGARTWMLLALSFGLFICALLSKTVTCALPAALILAMFRDRRGIDLRRLLPLVPFFVVGFALAMVTVVLERSHVGASGPEFDHSFIKRLAIAGRALIFYPAHMLWPSPLLFIHPRWEIDVASFSAWWPHLILFGAGAAGVLAWGRGVRGPLLAACLYGGMILPAIGFFNVYPHLFSFVAEHFAYHASIGLLMLLVGGTAHLVRKRTAWRSVAGGAGALLLLVCMSMTFSYAAIFTSLESLYRDTIMKNPGAWMARNNLSSELLRQAEAALAAGHGDRMFMLATEAGEHAERVLELRPAHHTAWANLSEAHRLLGRMDQALEAIGRALEELPEYGEYHWMKGRLLHLNRAYVEAAEAYDRAVELLDVRAPVSAERMRMDAGRALVRAAEEAESAGDGERARALRQDVSRRLAELMVSRPNDIDLLLLRARVHLAAGEEAEAVAVLEYAAAMTSDRAVAASVLSTLVRLSLSAEDLSVRSIDRARRSAEELVRATGGNDPGAIGVLAGVRAEEGRFEEADALLLRAESIARAAGLTELAQQLAARRDSISSRLREGPARE